MEVRKFRKQKKLDDTLLYFQEFRQLSDKYAWINLGEGTPYFDTPRFVLDNMIKAIEEGHNHYINSYGHPEARKLIAAHYQQQFDHTIDPLTEVLISNGAKGVMDCLIQAFLADLEDEIIFIEPFYAIYTGHAQNARGTIRTVPLVIREDNQWHLDLDILRETLNEKTRLIVINTPHNPTGKVFSLDELQEISDILEEYPHVYVLSDEVYDYSTFEGHEHHAFANIKDNWKKTVTVFSGGKLLCCTGWKIGWCFGPAEIIREAVVFNDITSTSNNTPGQIALAWSLKTAFEEKYEGFDNFIEYQKNDFKKWHDILLEGLLELDLPVKPIPASGTLFIAVDVSGLRDMVPEKYFKQEEYEDDKDTKIEKNDFGTPVPLDIAVSRWFAMEKKVATMPITFFSYRNSPHKSENFIRMAFCRGEKMTREAIENLKK